MVLRKKNIFILYLIEVQILHAIKRNKMMRIWDKKHKMAENPYLFPELLPIFFYSFQEWNLFIAFTIKCWKRYPRHVFFFSSVFLILSVTYKQSHMIYKSLCNSIKILVTLYTCVRVYINACVKKRKLFSWISWGI